MPKLVSGVRNVAANVVATLVIIGLIALWGVVVVWLAASGGDPVTFRLWMLLIAAAAIVTLLAW